LVWLLRGDTCHSVAWVNNTLPSNNNNNNNKNKGNTSSSSSNHYSVKKPNRDNYYNYDNQHEVLQLCHWNPWFGLSHNLTQFRLVTAPTQWKPPSLKIPPSTTSKVKRVTVMDLILERRRRQQEQKQALITANKNDNNIDLEETSSIKIHPEDFIQKIIIVGGLHLPLQQLLLLTLKNGHPFIVYQKRNVGL